MNTLTSPLSSTRCVASRYGDGVLSLLLRPKATQARSCVFSSSFSCSQPSLSSQQLRKASRMHMHAHAHATAGSASDICSTRLRLLARQIHDRGYNSKSLLSFHSRRPYSTEDKYDHHFYLVCIQHQNIEMA
jgi:hypothetical protein